MKKFITLITFVAITACNNNTAPKIQYSAVVDADERTYSINLDESQIVWTGREVSSSYHYGTLKFKSGDFFIINGIISSGTFIVDMNSLINLDLEGDSKSRLEGHLRSDDFFSVDSHPDAKITINGSDKISNGKWNVAGDLTIKNITHPITFEMINTDKGWVIDLTFDRSKYDVKFRSGSFFENLGDKLIYDDIELSVNLITL